MVDPEAPKKKKRKKLAVARAAYSQDEFCKAYGISRSHFFNLKKDGQGPREARIGKSVRITIAAAEEWAKAREQTA